MNTHKVARLTAHGRALLVRRVVDEGLRPEEVAQAQGVSVRTVYKSLNRYRVEGEAGLLNRSSRPRHVRLLKHAALNRLSALEPARPDNRYEHDVPGDLLHLDIKKLGRFECSGHRVTGNRQQNSRGAGWE